MTLHQLAKVVLLLGVVTTIAFAAHYGAIGYMNYVDPYVVKAHSREVAQQMDDAGYQLVCSLRCDADAPSLVAPIWQYRVDPLEQIPYGDDEITVPGQCQQTPVTNEDNTPCLGYYHGQSRGRGEYAAGGCDNMFDC